MKIKKVFVRNFRCIREAELPFDNLTVLVGPNGAGKSSFLQTLRLFYEANAEYSEEDFFNGDTSQPIEIRVTFTDLTPQEKNLFKSHIKDDELTVSKELTWPRGRGSQKYYGYVLGNPAFTEVRNASKVKDKRHIYTELRSQYPGLPELPGNASAQQIEEALQQWEDKNQERLEWIRDEGQFFGFKEVGQAKLERFTKLIFIPAVRDAAQEATEGKNAAISQLMDLVVRRTLSQREDLRQLREDTVKRYREIVDPNALTELQELQSRLSEDLKRFAPGTEVILKWDTSQGLEMPMPKADVKIREHDYEGAVEKAGHGTQRAFIFAILQRLSISEATKSENHEEGAEDSGVEPNIVIAIEEPELYQHPNRIRHISQVFLRLVKEGIPDVGSIQVIYATHSPLLVDLERFDQVRLVRRKRSADGSPKETIVHRAELAEITERLKVISGDVGVDYTVEGTKARLRTSMTPWTNEGFFPIWLCWWRGRKTEQPFLRKQH